MNQDEQARADIRALIEGVGVSDSVGPVWYAVTGLFVSCAGRDDIQDQTDPVSDQNGADKMSDPARLRQWSRLFIGKEILSKLGYSFDSDERQLIDELIESTEFPEKFSAALWRVALGLVRMGLEPTVWGDDEMLSLIPSLLSLMPLAMAESRAEVRRLHDWLDGLDLSTPSARRRAADVYDDGWRHMVARDEGLGQFITPGPVAERMLALADLKPGESVYDPCCGFGELLVGASRRVSAVSNPSSPDTRNGPAPVTAVEIELFAHLVTLCRLFLASVKPARLEWSDALAKPLPGDGSEGGFDCIVAAPPWGTASTASGNQLFPFPRDHVEGHFPFPGDHIEDLFLQHVMAKLRIGGRAVVALPQRPLFHADSLPLRKALLSEYRVQTVVALPAGAFEPHTAIPMNIVVFSRDEPGDAVRFATVSPMAWEAAREDATVISESINDRPLPAGSVSTGIESWSVPVSELALREYELIAKQSGNEMLDAEIGRLVKADRSLQVKPLAEVAEVFSGQPYESDEDLRHDFLMLLRATDVTDVRIRPPSYGLPEHLFGESGKPFLRGGDMLVPMEDTIGSVGFVEDERWDGVMAGHDIALVRPHAEIIRPGFLAALLRSPACWFWLSGHAAGSSIRQLSISVLRTLTIPVPPLPVQDAVIEALSGPRADALAVLHRLLSGAKKNPVADWLEKPLPARVVAAAGAADGLDAGDLSELASGILAISDTDYGSSGAWLRSARRAARTLKGYDTVPSVSGRLVILEHALVRFHEALHEIGRSEEELFDRLRACTRGMMRLAEQEVFALQDAATLDVDVNPPEVEAGVPCEVRLRMTNGSVPLRDLQVTARQPDGTATTAEAAYLAEGVTHEIPVAVRAPDSAESHRIDVAWQARHLDAAPHRDEAAVYVLVGPSQSVAQSDLGRSPYIVGNPVDRADMFFGRADIMDQIQRHLGGGDHANVVLLEGNRRTGKTSILRQLGKTGALPGWIPVYCSFQELDGMAAADVFKLLALRIGGALQDAGIETWIPGLERAESAKPFKIVFGSALLRVFSGGRPFETLELYLEAAIRAAKPRRVLLMIDEFDKLREGIDSGRTGAQVPENLRHLLQHQARLGAIITGSRRLKKLREEYWSALFGLGYRIGVSALPEEHARRLVTEPVAGRLRYLPQARDRLVSLCAGHPFLIQSLCSRVFDQAADGGERTITLDVLDRAVTEMVRDNEHFRTLWDYAGTERRRLVLMLCHRLAHGSDAVNISLLLRQFEKHRVRVRRDQEVADDIAELRELELVDLDTSYRDGTYRLSIPLMARWMEMNVDFDELVVRAGDSSG